MVTTLIFTPKTPVCFLDGVLFRLMSRLVNFMENSTLIWSGSEVGTKPPGHKYPRGDPSSPSRASLSRTENRAPLSPKGCMSTCSWEREDVVQDRRLGWDSGAAHAQRGMGGTPAGCSVDPTYPIHLDHIRVPVLGFDSLWIQLQAERGNMREGERGGGGQETGPGPALPLLLGQLFKGQEGQKLECLS